MRISDWSSDVCSSDLVYASGRVIEAGCWAHARRGFYDIHARQATPITTHVLEQLGALHKIEAGIRGRPRDVRRAVRQQQRQEERSVGKERGSPYRSRWTRYH